MLQRQKIAVTGASGQLGQAIKEVSRNYPQFEFDFLDRAKLSIADEGALKEYFSAGSPQFLVNCAAYTAVDKAEEEKELAFAINDSAVSSLAILCREYNTGFIHISTDYVFDGNSDQPYDEEAKTNPLNIYGASKLAGEKSAIEENPEAIIIRSSWIYARTGKNFVKTMVRLMKEKDELKIVNDQFGSPTYAPDLAEAILQIISSQQWVAGIYHFGNEGIISWYEFAVAIRELIKSNCLLHPIPSAEYPTTACRPLYSVLDKKKIRQVFGIQSRNWKQGLANCLAILK